MFFQCSNYSQGLPSGGRLEQDCVAACFVAEKSLKSSFSSSGTFNATHSSGFLLSSQREGIGIIVEHKNRLKVLSRGGRERHLSDGAAGQEALGGLEFLQVCQENSKQLCQREWRALGYKLVFTRTASYTARQFSWKMFMVRLYRGYSVKTGEEM